MLLSIYYLYMCFKIFSIWYACLTEWRAKIRHENSRLLSLNMDLALSTNLIISHCLFITMMAAVPRPVCASTKPSKSIRTVSHTLYNAKLKFYIWEKTEQNIQESITGIQLWTLSSVAGVGAQPCDAKKYHLLLMSSLEPKKLTLSGLQRFSKRLELSPFWYEWGRWSSRYDG